MLKTNKCENFTKSQSDLLIKLSSRVEEHTGLKFELSWTNWKSVYLIETESADTIARFSDHISPNHINHQGFVFDNFNELFKGLKKWLIENNYISQKSQKQKKEKRCTIWKNNEPLDVSWEKYNLLKKEGKIKMEFKSTYENFVLINGYWND